MEYYWIICRWKYPIGLHFLITVLGLVLAEDGAIPAAGNESLSEGLSWDFPGRIFPPLEYQETRMGSEFSMSCTFGTVGQKANIRWERREPIFYDNGYQPTRSIKQEFQTIYSSDEEGKDVVTLISRTSKNSTSDEIKQKSGYYYCIFDRSDFSSPLVVRQYVFISDGYNDSIQPNFPYSVPLNAFNVMVIKPTNPNMTLKIYKTKDRFNRPLNIQIDLDNDNWSYHPYQGLNIPKVKLIHEGQFRVEKFNNGVASNHINMTIQVKGVAMTVSNENPVEGSDVILSCQSFRLNNKPKWYFKNNSTNQTQIDPDDQPQISSAYPHYATSILTIKNVTKNATGMYRCEEEYFDQLSNSEFLMFDTKHLKVLNRVLRNNGSEPKIFEHSDGRLDPPNDHQVALIGSTFNISCSFDTTGQHDYIRWEMGRVRSDAKKNPPINRPIIEDRFGTFRSMDENGKDTVTMVMRDVDIWDLGFYKCILDADPPIVKKQYVYVDDPIQLPVMFSLDNIDKDMIEYTFSIGHSALVSCRPAHPSVTINFYRYISIKKRWEKIPIRNSNDGWNFSPYEGISLKKVSFEDSGKYRCEGKRGSKTKTVEITILVKDVIVLGPVGDVFEGQNVTLDCKSFSHEKPDWSVTLNGKEEVPINYNSFNLGFPNESGTQFSENSHYAEESDLNFTSTLTITHVTKEVEGIYKCQKPSVNHDKNLSWYHLKVFDSEKPAITDLHGNDLNAIINQGESRNFSCKGSGRPEPQIYWVKNGDKSAGILENNIIFQNRGNISQTTLELTSVKLEHSGTYTCFFENLKGVVNQTFTLKVNPIGLKPESVLSQSSIIAIAFFMVLLVVALIASYFFIRKFKNAAGSSKRLKQLLKGNPERINPNGPLEEQIDMLPYDEKWEFPQNRLRLGTQLGVGCFGRVIKGEAVGIKDGEEVTTVAVKMIKSKANLSVLEDLVSELKILIHLGSHLNVVNLLGACTKKIAKGDLMIIVEYCRFGNLLSVIKNNKNIFVNQPCQEERDANVDDQTDNSDGQIQSKHNEYVSINIDPPKCQYAATSSGASGSISNNPTEEVNCTTLPSFSTDDLICWSFQIARGMDYLVDRKVLHGDLAARNVLLADNNVVKVADFGMSRKLYMDENYQKTSKGLLPVKWMAIESLTDRTFSSKSDVWSYGILLWELFSLGQFPYPGISADERLISRLKDGYRMNPPEYAPDFIGEMMNNCWKKLPEDRPTFNQLENIICQKLDSPTRDYYIQLNDPYVKLNEKRMATSSLICSLSLMMEGTRTSLHRTPSGTPNTYVIHDYSRN